MTFSSLAPAPPPTPRAAWIWTGYSGRVPDWRSRTSSASHGFTRRRCAARHSPAELIGAGFHTVLAELQLKYPRPGHRNCRREAAHRRRAHAARAFQEGHRQAAPVIAQAVLGVPVCQAGQWPHPACLFRPRTEPRHPRGLPPADRPGRSHQRHRVNHLTSYIGRLHEEYLTDLLDAP